MFLSYILLGVRQIDPHINVLIEDSPTGMNTIFNNLRLRWYITKNCHSLCLYWHSNISGNSTFTRIEIGECSMKCGSGFLNEITYECKVQSKTSYDCEIIKSVRRTCLGPLECIGKSNICSLCLMYCNDSS